jgi:uncharacterized protein YndB with AHSA1/START domain
MSTTDMPEQNIKLQLDRVFDAPREQVWRTWTNPAQHQRWFGAKPACGASLLSVQADARVGGRYRFQSRNPDGLTAFLSNT